MGPTKNQDLPSEPQAVEDAEEVIDLTQILEEGASETVIEISAQMDELDSLDLKSLLSQEAETEPARGPKEDEEASLEDLLSSLKEPAGESLAKAVEPVPEPPSLPPASEPIPPPEMAVPPLAAAAPVEDVRQQIQASVNEDQIRQIVRLVVQEIAERLCREMFPEIASAVVSREIAALKKSLEEEI
jgi:hypothetical protein